MLGYNDDPMSPHEAQRAKLARQLRVQFEVMPRAGKGDFPEVQCRNIQAALTSGKPDPALMPKKPDGAVLD